MHFKNIELTKKESLTIITIHRPKKLNALNKLTLEEVHDALQILEDDASVKAIVITGKGEKAFIAGADIAEFANFGEKEGSLLSKKGQIS